MAPGFAAFQCGASGGAVQDGLDGVDVYDCFLGSVVFSRRVVLDVDGLG